MSRSSSRGRDVALSGTSSKLVHCVDLFSTILDLAKLSAPTGVTIDSRSLLPVMKGRDITSRQVVSERFNSGTTGDGRSIISADFPEYKLIAFGDPTTAADTTNYHIYRISTDANEQIPLAIPPASDSAHSAAYQALLAKDQSLGPAAATGTTLYLQLPTTPGGAAGVPANAAVIPDSVTVNGSPATYVARFNQSEAYDQYWVKCTVPASLAAPYNSAVVAFPNNPMTGDTRSFSAINIIPAP